MTIRHYNMRMNTTKEPRKVRNIRATDAEWIAIRLVGIDRLRAWAVAVAKKLTKELK